MPETYAGTAPTAHFARSSQALAFEEIVVDVRKDKHVITAEAMCPRGVGITFCRHGKSGEDPETIIDALIESVEKLGISAGRYRIVREDLPPQPVLQFRDKENSRLATSASFATGDSPRDSECEPCDDPGRRGECQEENFAEEGESCACSYCICMNDTQYGEICSECRAVAHQG